MEHSFLSLRAEQLKTNKQNLFASTKIFKRLGFESSLFFSSFGHAPSSSLKSGLIFVDKPKQVDVGVRDGLWPRLCRPTCARPRAQR